MRIEVGGRVIFCDGGPGVGIVDVQRGDERLRMSTTDFLTLADIIRAAFPPQ